jgi:exopolysaccharide production protein ExoZ
LAYVAMPHLSAGNRDWAWLPTLTLLPVDSAPALSVAWTLKHEMLFYILFGLFYFSRLLPLGLAAWGFGIAILPHVPFQAINVEFFMGMLAAILYRERQASPALLIFAPVPFLLWIYLGATDETSILTGLGFMLIIAPIAQMEREERFVVPRWLVFLGAGRATVPMLVALESLCGRAVGEVNRRWEPLVSEVDIPGDMFGHAATAFTTA